jgi:hypothetical protein
MRKTYAGKEVDVSFDPGVRPRRELCPRAARSVRHHA